MSEKISKNPKIPVLYYIYKITFKSGRTYVGQHTQKRKFDNYITSSSYAKRHQKDDPIISREILIYVKDPKTLDIMETICICEDKAVMGKLNVNGNYGNWYLKYHSGSRLGTVLSEETKRKISEAHKGKLFRNKYSKEERKDKFGLPGDQNGMFGRRGNLSPSFGRKLTKAQKNRISKKLKDSWKNLTEDERQERIQNAKKNLRVLKGEEHPLYGVGHSDEAKKKMSESHKKRYEEHPEERYASINKKKEKYGEHPHAGSLNPAAKKVRCIETGDVFGSIVDAQKAYRHSKYDFRGANRKIGAVINGHIELAFGMHWELTETID